MVFGFMHYTEDTNTLGAKMITWGLVGNSHDASLAVFETKVAGLTDKIKTKLLWAVLAKDFSGVPNDPHFNDKMFDIAVQAYGKPQKIVWYERPFLKTLRQWRAGQGWLARENNIKKYLERWHIYVPIEYTLHHESHAAYAYYTQPHDNCAVICLDSIGEFETLTVWHGKDNKLKKIYSQMYPHSLGLFYSAMTQRVGLQPQRDEYKIAQMAEKGDPFRLIHVIKRDLLGNTHRYFNTKENLHRGCMWWRPELKTEKDMNDIAAATQAIFEDALQCISYMAHQKTDADHLALAGGGALNKQGIDKIKRHWESIWVPPNPGDPGSCIGAVLAKSKQKIILDKQWYKAVQL